MKYFLVRGSERFGPYTLEDLRFYLGEGNVVREDVLEPEEGGAATSVGVVLGESTPAPEPKAVVPPPIPASHRKVEPKPAPVAQPQPATGSKAALLAIPVTLGFLALGVATLFVLPKIPWAEIGQAQVPLMEDRQGHQTNWTANAEAEENLPPDEPPEEIFELVHYPSPVGELAAYLTPDPGDGKKHPAIVWAKGGFGGISGFLWEEAPSRSDDQTGRAFREAGIVMMCPSFRGENDNPGRFEFFYGEVNDFLEAIEYVKQLPYVDPDRVYIGGHSVGGTLTLLAAVAGEEFRAAFSFGGMPDMVDLMSDGEGYGNTPYPVGSHRDNQLRSPIRYTKYIRRPTFYFEGSDSWFYVDAAKRMESIAKRVEVPFESYELPGDHFDILAPTTRLVAKQILQDTGEECSISFDQNELVSAWKAMHNISLTSEFSKWIQDGGQGDLQPIIDNLEEEAIAESYEDIQAIRATVQEVDPKAPTALNNIAILATMAFDIEDETILKSFRSRVSPLLQNWARKIARRGAKATEDETFAFFEIVDAEMLIGDIAGADFTWEMMQTGFSEDNYEDWSDALSWVDTWAPGYTRLVELCRKQPPTGLMGQVLLERGNQSFFDDDYDGFHTFDSAKGGERFQEWIESGSQNDAFYAAVGMAFVSAEVREPLLDLALNHWDTGVQLEAAWADLRNNGKKGLKRLQEACLDLNYAATAISYMEELSWEEEIPEAAQEPDYVAKIQMIDWLKDPSEIGHPPLTIEQVDTRELYWPPSDDRRQVWLFRFTYRFEEDDPLRTGYGMYGSTTWSSFEDYTSEPDPADLYAHHCALEISWEEDLETSMTASEGLEVLREHNPGMFD